MNAPRCLDPRAPVEYKVLDATDMGYEHVFNAVVDKGTLDALNCGDFEVVEKLVMSMEYPGRRIPSFS